MELEMKQKTLDGSRFDLAEKIQRQCLGHTIVEVIDVLALLMADALLRAGIAPEELDGVAALMGRAVILNVLAKQPARGSA